MACDACLVCPTIVWGESLSERVSQTTDKSESLTQSYTVWEHCRCDSSVAKGEELKGRLFVGETAVKVSERKARAVTGNASFIFITIDIILYVLRGDNWRLMPTIIALQMSLILLNSMFTAFDKHYWKHDSKHMINKNINKSMNEWMNEWISNKLSHMLVICHHLRH